MRRREFLGVLSGAATAWPLAARAQQSPMPVIGFLDLRSPEALTERLRGFRQGLKETGYVEGDNATILYRWAENRLDRIPEFAAELARRPVALIVASGGPHVALTRKSKPRSRQSLSFSFPVKTPSCSVWSRASPVPVGNLTGINFFSGELVAKRLELMRVLVPAATRVAVLVNPTGANTEATLRDVEPAARTLGQQIQVLNASTIHEINAAFATFVRERPDALFVGGDAFLDSRRVQLVELANHHRVPATYSAA